jgi:hypothetical protein
LERDLLYAAEDLGVIQRYIEQISKHIETARSTRLNWYVEFRREHNHATKHTNYRIAAFQLPDITDAETRARRMYASIPYAANPKGSPSNPFLGNEKRLAIECAREMSEKYDGCEIIGNAAELVKPVKGVIVL